MDNNKLFSFGAVGLVVGLLAGQFLHRNDYANGRFTACSEFITPFKAQGIPVECIKQDGEAYLSFQGHILRLDGSEVK
jgi:hypothetical protein